MFIITVILFFIIWLGAYKGKHFVKSVLWVVLIYLVGLGLAALGVMPIL